MPDQSRASRQLTDCHGRVRAAAAKLDKVRPGGGDRLREEAAAALARVLDQHLGMANTTTTTTRRGTPR